MIQFIVTYHLCTFIAGLRLASLTTHMLLAHAYHVYRHSENCAAARAVAHPVPLLCLWTVAARPWPPRRRVRGVRTV